MQVRYSYITVVSYICAHVKYYYSLKYRSYKWKGRELSRHYLEA